ncbi:hypothetical protein RJ035_004307 [Blastomyces gilchristii]
MSDEQEGLKRLDGRFAIRPSMGGSQLNLTADCEHTISREKLTALESYLTLLNLTFRIMMAHSFTASKELVHDLIYLPGIKPTDGKVPRFPFYFSPKEKAEVERDMDGLSLGMQAMQSINDNVRDLFPEQGIARPEQRCGRKIDHSTIDAKSTSFSRVNMIWCVVGYSAYQAERACYNSQELTSGILKNMWSIALLRFPTSILNKI